jgi:hypothetical protein
MSDPFRRVAPGERLTIHAAAWNRTMDVVSPRADFGGAQAADALLNFRVAVRNDTTGLADIYSVLKIGNAIISPTGGAGGQFSAVPVFIGTEPDEDTGAGFCVLAAPCATGAYAMGAVAGVTPVKLNVIDADHRYAKAKDGDITELQTAVAGPAFILWKESGTGGGKWGYVRLGNDDESFRLGRVTGGASGAWAKDTTGSVEPIDENGTALATGIFEASNWFADVTIATGYARVACHKFGPKWFLIAAECLP